MLAAEAFGSEDPLLDVEMIALLADLYDRLGVPGVRLRISSMGDADGEWVREDVGLSVRDDADVCERAAEPLPE